MIPVEFIINFIQLAGLFFILVGLVGFSFMLGKYTTWSTGRNEMKRLCKHTDKVYYDKGKYKWKCLNCGHKLKGK